MPKFKIDNQQYHQDLHLIKAMYMYDSLKKYVCYIAVEWEIAINSNTSYIPLY